MKVGDRICLNPLEARLNSDPDMPALLSGTASLNPLEARLNSDEEVMER